MPTKSEAKKPMNSLLIVTIILAIALIGVIGYLAYDKMVVNGGANGFTVVSSDKAAASLVSFINEVYGDKVGQVTLKSVTEKNGMYEVTLSMSAAGTDGTAADQVVYVTKDAKIFVPQIIDIATMEQQYKDYMAQQAAQPDVTPAETTPDTSSAAEDEASQ